MSFADAALCVGVWQFSFETLEQLNDIVIEYIWLKEAHQGVVEEAPSNRRSRRYQNEAKAAVGPPT